MCFLVGMQHATQASWFSLRPRLLRYSGRRSSIVWRQIMVRTMRPLAWVVSSPYHAYISFSSTPDLYHPYLYNFVQISENSIWNVFRSLDRFFSYFSSSIRSSNHRQRCYRIQIPLANLCSPQSLHSMTELCSRLFYHLYFSTWL